MMLFGIGIIVFFIIVGLSDSSYLQEVIMCILDLFNLNKLSYFDYYVIVFKVGVGFSKVQNYKYFLIYS